MRQCTTMLIPAFCKTCKHEIVLQECKTKTIFCSQLLQNTWIIKQTVVLLWKFWRKYQSVSYLFQNFRSNTTACLIIHMFCKVYDRGIVFVLICRTARTISSSQLLQNMGIIKQIVVLLWKFWKKHESVSYSFSCKLLPV